MPDTMGWDNREVAGMAHGDPRQAALIAYMAGIMDGEGSIRIQKVDSRKKHNRRSMTYYAQLNLGMVDYEVVRLFADTFGGHVREERVPSRRSIWRWTLSGREQVMSAIQTMEPFLIVKKKHAQVVLDFLGRWEHPYNKSAGVSASELQRREEAYQVMRKLNAVGAAATTERVGSREGEATV